MTTTLLEIPQPQYSELSIKLTKLLPKKTKKDYGIFITPRILTEKMYLRVKQFKDAKKIPDFARILEPSCGTCEMITYLNTLIKDSTILGIEQNPILFDNIKDLFSSNNNNNNSNNNNTVILQNQDFISYPIPEIPFDFIIGNPPYVVCKKEQVPIEYRPYIAGRPNLFGTFILHSLAMLKMGGILAFVVPKSFLNAAYYAKIRDYIKETCDIIDILDFESNDEFLETQQATLGLILHKRENPHIISTSIPDCAYSLRIGDHFAFSSNCENLKTLLLGSTSLNKLGLAVKTGTIVWNQVKPLLTSNSDEGILLLYNSNISKKNTIELQEFCNNEEKHQYIMADGNKEPVLIVNRGNGNSAYRLSWALVDLNEVPYLVENHLNVIYSTQKREKSVLLQLFNQIIHSFQDTRTLKFIQLFLGNNGLSKTELETIFPIYL